MNIEADKLDAMLRAMPEDWRSYWCESEVCACRGCANGSGGLSAAGVEKAEWEAALKRIKPS